MRKGPALLIYYHYTVNTHICVMRSIYLGFLIVYWHNSRVLIPVDTPHLHNKGLLCNTLCSRYVRKQHSTLSPVLKFISVIITRHTKESNQPRLVVFNPSDRTLWIAAPSNSRFLYLVSIVEKRLQIFLFFLLRDEPSFV